MISFPLLQKPSMIEVVALHFFCPVAIENKTPKVKNLTYSAFHLHIFSPTESRKVHFYTLNYPQKSPFIFLETDGSTPFHLNWLKYYISFLYSINLDWNRFLVVLLGCTLKELRI